MGWKHGNDSPGRSLELQPGFRGARLCGGVFQYPAILLLGAATTLRPILRTASLCTVHDVVLLPADVLRVLSGTAPSAAAGCATAATATPRGAPAAAAGSLLLGLGCSPAAATAARCAPTAASAWRAAAWTDVWASAGAKRSSPGPYGGAAPRTWGTTSWRAAAWADVWASAGAKRSSPGPHGGAAPRTWGTSSGAATPVKNAPWLL